ncbi:MAG: hypothetical protein D6761_13060, partial [Candidatus Dadabacteria bacterium]
MRRQVIRFTACFAVGLLLLSCDDSSTSLPVHFVVDPAVVPDVDPHRLPFPSDLYRTADGSYRFAAAPGVLNAEMLLPGLASLGGFGTQQGVFFGLTAGDVEDDDALRLAFAAVTPDVDGCGGLIELDGADSVTSAAETHLDRRTLLVSVWPRLGQPLSPGARVLAWLSRSCLADALQRPVDVVDPLPELVGDAVAEAADAGLLDPADIAVATVYTTQRVRDDLDAIALQIEAAAAPQPFFEAAFYGAGLTGARPLKELYGTPAKPLPGRDNEGGIIHDHVAQVFTGTITLTVWSDTFGREPFNRDENGVPTPFGTQTAQFVMTLPDCPQPAAGYPVVIVQHGLGDNKEFLLALSDALSEECLATVGIDAVAHAFRSRRPRDVEHNITDEPGPDGLDDGFPYGGLDQIFLLNPEVARTNLLETAAGLLQLARAIRNRSWQPPAGALRAGLKFDRDKVGYIGQSMGGIVGSLFNGTTTDITTAVINVGGGNFIRIAEESPVFEKATVVFSIGSEDPVGFEPPDRWHFGYSLFQGVLDGADPVNFAVRFAKAPRAGAPRKHMLFQAAWLDQLVPNAATSALVRAGGFP